MESIKYNIMRKLLSENPRIDLTYFEEIYKATVKETYGILKIKSCVCYNKSCGRRVC